MKQNEAVKTFSAVSYDGHTYNFVVTPEGSINCLEFHHDIQADKIEIKPNFVLRDKESRTMYSLADHYRNNAIIKTQESLISEWHITDDLFWYLVNHNKIMYSTSMALLYGFNPELAFDKPFQKKLINISKKKPGVLTKRLAPLKSGKFH